MFLPPADMSTCARLPPGGAYRKTTLGILLPQRAGDGVARRKRLFFGPTHRPGRGGGGGGVHEQRRVSCRDLWWEVPTPPHPPTLLCLTAPQRPMAPWHPNYTRSHQTTRPDDPRVGAAAPPPLGGRRRAGGARRSSTHPPPHPAPSRRGPGAPRRTRPVPAAAARRTPGAAARVRGCAQTTRPYSYVLARKGGRRRGWGRARRGRGGRLWGERRCPGAGAGQGSAVGGVVGDLCQSHAHAAEGGCGVATDGSAPARAQRGGGGGSGGGAGEGRGGGGRGSGRGGAGGGVERTCPASLCPAGRRGACGRGRVAGWPASEIRRQLGGRALAGTVRWRPPARWSGWRPSGPTGALSHPAGHSGRVAKG